MADSSSRTFFFHKRWWWGGKIGLKNNEMINRDDKKNIVRQTWRDRNNGRLACFERRPIDRTRRRKRQINGPSKAA